MTQASITKSSPTDSPRTLAFGIKNSSRNSKGFTPSEGGLSSSKDCIKSQRYCLSGSFSFRRISIHRVSIRRIPNCRIPNHQTLTLTLTLRLTVTLTLSLTLTRELEFGEMEFSKFKFCKFKFGELEEDRHLAKWNLASWKDTACRHMCVGQIRGPFFYCNQLVLPG